MIRKLIPALILSLVLVLLLISPASALSITVHNTVISVEDVILGERTFVDNFHVEKTLN